MLILCRTSVLYIWVYWQAMQNIYKFVCFHALFLIYAYFLSHLPRTEICLLSPFLLLGHESMDIRKIDPKENIFNSVRIHWSPIKDDCWWMLDKIVLFCDYMSYYDKGCIWAILLLLSNEDICFLHIGTSFWN